MQIFALDRDPVLAAQAQCDKHVIKMILESHQLLMTAHGARAWRNHPCAVWVRESRGNYEWLNAHGRALVAEYAFRYGRTHAYADRFDLPDVDLPDLGLTEFAQTMPDQYKRDDSVAAFRAYYTGEKARFARWAKGRAAPAWWAAEAVAA